MSDDLFPILGTLVPPLLGRTDIVKRMMDSLTKPVPDHLQVVGPRFAGKTVLLQEVAERIRKAGAPYTTAVMWDVGHQTPRTDAQFMKFLARELAASLNEKHRDYAIALNNAEDNPFYEIAEVLDLLKEDGCKVLLILDGFDKPLSNGQLTRNLWDQLRELALKPSLRIVTASRHSLRDLIRHPDAQTSDFWNIFDPTPVRVGCFDESDLVLILSKLPGRRLSPGARTELWNASNGFPVLMLGVLNAASATGADETISQENMKSACESAFPTLRDKLDSLWNDCPHVSQDLLRRVVEEQSVPRLGIAPSIVDALLERGFVSSIANKLQKPSRLLCKYLEEEPNEGNALVRLFGSSDAYLRNLKGVLERRTAHLGAIDPMMKRLLERALDDLPAHPRVFMTNIRGIVDQAFELIWQAEIPDRRIPSGWMSLWKQNNERSIDEWETTFPQGGRRLNLLKLMTGSERSSRCSKHVTKETYCLLNAAYSFSDFGQHLEGSTIALGTAYAALQLCVELAAALIRELPPAKL